MAFFKIRCFSHFWNAPRFSRVIPSKPADFAPLPLVPLRRSHWRPASSMNGPCHLSSSCLCWCHKIPRRLVLGSGGFSLVEKNYRVGTYDRSKWSYNRKKNPVSLGKWGYFTPISGVVGPYLCLVTGPLCRMVNPANLTPASCGIT